jgi:hypothetical protein
VENLLQDLKSTKESELKAKQEAAKFLQQQHQNSLKLKQLETTCLEQNKKCIRIQDQIKGTYSFPPSSLKQRLTEQAYRTRVKVGNFNFDDKDFEATLSHSKPAVRSGSPILHIEGETHLRKGKGTLIFKSGAVFEGYLLNDKMFKGRYIWEDGEMYVGDYVDNKKHGQGKRIFNDGSTYTGSWTNDLIEGYGVMVYEDGTRYEG